MIVKMMMNDYGIELASLSLSHFGWVLFLTGPTPIGVQIEGEGRVKVSKLFINIHIHFYLFVCCK